ncbi:MAG: response regulator [Holosporales bacterium]|nr:response regulator [Holosporales bacterium]
MWKVIDSFSQTISELGSSCEPYKFYILLITVIIALLLGSVMMYRKMRRELNAAEYYLDVVRIVSRSLAKTHRIIAFNEAWNVIYTTHPNMYTTKKEFLQDVLGSVTASVEFKNFCRLFEARRPTSALLSGSGSGLQNQFKRWVAMNDIVEAEESLVDESVSVVTMSDISKYMDDGERTAHRCERLEDFIDRLPFGIFYLGNSGKIIGANTTFANMINSTKDRIMDTTIGDFIDGIDDVSELTNRAYVTVKPRFSKRFTAVAERAVALSGYKPWIIYKVIAQEPRNTQDAEGFLLQSIFVSTNVPSVVVNSECEIQAMNPAFATMIQDKVTIDKSKVIGHGSSIAGFASSGDSEDSLADYIRKASQSPERFSSIEVKLQGGNNITAMGYVSQIDPIPPVIDKPKLLLIQFIDISGQKALEQRLVQSQKMQAIGQLAGGVAHDFNNLLTAMIGFCDLLLQRYTSKDPSYSDVIQIKQNATRAANLVRQLLAFSKQQTLKPRVVSITELLIDLSSLLKRLLGPSMEFQVIHGRDLWNVKLDNIQFEHVIINLVVNARDAMKNSGKLTIQTRNHFADKNFKCVYDTASPGDYVLIEVIDTGCGIATEMVEDIFEPFFSRSGGDSQKKLGAGTGLGLSTVYGIINQTGGFIAVESEVGKGANFKIYIPRYMGDEQIHTGSASIIPRDLSGSETVLIVEDEDSVRMFSARTLREKGYKVLEASSGDEAIKIAQSSDFDLLVTDVVMPKMDGPTLCRAIKDMGKNVKTIFISGYSEDTFRKDVGKNPMIHFLQKPFTLQGLAGKVKEVLSK